MVCGGVVEVADLHRFSLTPSFSWVLSGAVEVKTVSTVFCAHGAERDENC